MSYGLSRRRVRAKARRKTGRRKQARPRKKAARRAAPKRKAKRARARPRAKKARKVKRYNPDTGRQVSVDADSIEAQEWPTRKPARSKALQKAERQLTRSAERAVTTTLRKAASPRARATAAAAAATVAGAVARGVVGAAAILAVHEAAKYILQDMPSLDPQVRLARLAVRAREARSDLAARLGRSLTAAEQLALAEAYRTAVAREQRATETERQRSIK